MHPILTKFDELTVYVDYRYFCGDKQPTQKALRARVVENWQVTGKDVAQLLADLREPIFGTPIAKQQNLMTFSQVRMACIKELGRYTKKLVFLFHPLVLENPRFNREGLDMVLECEAKE